MEIVFQRDLVIHADHARDLRDRHAEIAELELGRRGAGDRTRGGARGLDLPGGRARHAVDRHVAGERERHVAGGGEHCRQALRGGRNEDRVREGVGLDRVAPDEVVATILVRDERAQVDREPRAVANELAIGSDHDRAIDFRGLADRVVGEVEADELLADPVARLVAFGRRNEADRGARLGGWRQNGGYAGGGVVGHDRRDARSGSGAGVERRKLHYDRKGNEKKTRQHGGSNGYERWIRATGRRSGGHGKALAPMLNEYAAEMRHVGSPGVLHRPPRDDSRTERTVMTAPPRPVRADQASNLKALARLMDSAVAIPGTNIRLGLDSVIGLIPGLGDLAGAAMSGYIVLAAAKLGVPTPVLIRMVANVAVDGVIGSIPLLGDLFDVGFRANLRNTDLIERHLDNPVATKRASMGVVAGIVRALVLLAVGEVGVRIAVVRAVF